MMSSVDFGDLLSLVERVTTAPHGVAILAGAGLNIPRNSTSSGVPGTEGIIDIIRSHFEGNSTLLEHLENKLRTSRNRYQAAFKHLLHTRSQDIANQVVRRAVLQAYTPHQPSNWGPEIDETACREAELNLAGWALQPAVKAMGSLLTDFPNHFAPVVLTSNFDPLIELAIVRAAGRAFTSALHSDGSLSQTDAAGCHVVHIHGDWFRSDTLHTPAQLEQKRPKLSASLARILQEKTLLIVGYGGWDDVFMHSLAEVIEGGQANVNVVWTFYEANEQKIIDQNQHIFERLQGGIGRGRVNFYAGIDAHEFFPMVLQRLDEQIPIRPRHLQAAAYYRRFLDRRLRHFPLTGLASDDEPVLLRQLYVPQLLTQQPVSDHVPEAKLHEQGRSIIEWLKEASRDDDGGTRVQPGRSNVFLISGEAGSGKTTLAGSIVTSLEGTIGDELNRRFKHFLAFPILLRDAPVDRLESLDELITWWLNEAVADEPSLVPDDIRTFLDIGHGILLLDGLDELGTLDRRLRVLRWLRGHRWIVPGAGHLRVPNLTVITARPSGFEGLTEEIAAVSAFRLYLAPFSFDQIRTFLTRWFALRPMPLARRSEQVEGLISRLEKEPLMSQLRTLARRPAYLASLAFVHGTRGALPHSRAVLYELLVDVYIDTLDRQRGLAGRYWDRQEKRDLIAAVAFQVNSGTTNSAGADGDRRFAFSRMALETAVAHGIQNGHARFRTIALGDARELVDYFIARTGLLVESREGVYQFGHLGFQEYLSALFLLDRASGSADKAVTFEKLLLDRLDRPGCQDIALLALAIDVTRTNGTGHRAILMRLRPGNSAHVNFLARILAGDEVPLEPQERCAWVVSWLMAAAGKQTQSHFGFVNFDRNEEAIEQVWKTTCEAMLTGKSLLTALRALIMSYGTAKGTARDPFTDIVGVSEALDPLDGPMRWAFVVPVPAEPLYGAAEILATLYACSSVLAKAPLVRITETVPLFSTSSKIPGVPLPTPLWEALNLWEYQDGRLRSELRARTPLTWIYIDPSESYQITFLARLATHAPASFESWQQKVFRRLLDVERFFYGATIRFNGADVPSAMTAIAMDRARVARDIREWLVRGLQHNLSFPNKYDSPARPLFLLRLAQEDALLSDDDVRNSIRRRGIIAKDGRVGVALGSLSGRKSFSLAERVAVMSCVSLEVLNDILGTSASLLDRSTLQSWRDEFASPAAMAETLPIPLRERASREWQELLDSAASPLAILDAVLACEWSNLDLRTDAA